MVRQATMLSEEIQPVAALQWTRTKRWACFALLPSNASMAAVAVASRPNSHAVSVGNLGPAIDLRDRPARSGARIRGGFMRRAGRQPSLSARQGLLARQLRAQPSLGRFARGDGRLHPLPLRAHDRMRCRDRRPPESRPQHGHAHGRFRLQVHLLMELTFNGFRSLAGEEERMRREVDPNLIP